jgi:hypothetical protein
MRGCAVLEWIALQDAARWLATRLDIIDPKIAEDIIRNAMESDPVPVRGVPFGSASVVPRIISKEEIRSILRRQPTVGPERRKLLTIRAERDTLRFV